MADRRVIYDPDLEVGAIIDLDENRAIGPISVGPNAQGELQAFIDRMPDAVLAELSSYSLARAYMQFWDANFAAFYQAPAADTADTLEPIPDGRSDDAALAQHEAAAGAGDPPAPAPADPDVEADESPPPQVASEPLAAALPPLEGNGQARTVLEPCFACSGSGRVPGGTEGVVVVCNLCKGTGEVERTVTA